MAVLLLEIIIFLHCIYIIFLRFTFWTVALSFFFSSGESHLCEFWTISWCDRDCVQNLRLQHIVTCTTQLIVVAFVKSIVITKTNSKDFMFSIRLCDIIIIRKYWLKLRLLIRIRPYQGDGVSFSSFHLTLSRGNHYVDRWMVQSKDNTFRSTFFDILLTILLLVILTRSILVKSYSQQSHKMIRYE